MQNKTSFLKHLLIKFLSSFLCCRLASVRQFFFFYDYLFVPLIRESISCPMHTFLVIYFFYFGIKKIPQNVSCIFHFQAIVTDENESKPDEPPSSVDDYQESADRIQQGLESSEKNQSKNTQFQNCSQIYRWLLIK